MSERLRDSHPKPLAWYMWDLRKHTDDETIRWAYLRAIEWRDFPLFIAQPIVPCVLLLASGPIGWWAVPFFFIFLTIVWRLDTATRWPVPDLSDTGPYFVRLKFIIAPLSAFLLWKANHQFIAIEALLWPFIGTAIAQLILIFPMSIISLLPNQKSSEIGVVQSRLLVSVGFLKQEDPPRYFSKPPFIPTLALLAVLLATGVWGYFIR